MTENDSIVRCTECGRERDANFAHCLGNGWPKCCGYTMRLERTDANIGDAVAGQVNLRRET